MKAIGGYFGLETNQNEEYHKNSICLNSGRSSLEYILRANLYKKIYIPYYTCDVILQPIKRLGIKYNFYSINKYFEPIFDFNQIRKDEVFLYNNYFGLKDVYIEKLSAKISNLIIDNAQSFFSKPIPNTDTFYSPRKFFGVPDGGYLYSKKNLNSKITKDISYNRFEHLLRRVDVDAENGYGFFQKNEKSMDNSSLLEMSNLTQQLLKSINYQDNADKRKANFNFLHKSLNHLNELDIEVHPCQVPMTYPLLSGGVGLRQKLINSKIFTPMFWKNVLDWAPKSSMEIDFSLRIIHLPIDHRYNLDDMEIILKRTKSLI